jgi:hypothetical protein
MMKMSFIVFVAALPLMAHAQTAGPDSTHNGIGPAATGSSAGPASGRPEALPGSAPLPGAIGQANSSAMTVKPGVGMPPTGPSASSGEATPQGHIIAPSTAPVQR